MPRGRSRTAREAIAEGFKYIGTPYVWGGGSLSRGIDCSHFVCACFGMGYLTTHSMVFSNELASRDFTRHSISIGMKPGDIVVQNNGSGGHTGICAKRNGAQGVLQSAGGVGVCFIGGHGGDAWTTIWRPLEGGGGVVPVKWTKS